MFNSLRAIHEKRNRAHELPIYSYIQYSYCRYNTISHFKFHLQIFILFSGNIAKIYMHMPVQCITTLLCLILTHVPNTPPNEWKEIQVHLNLNVL